MREIKKVFRAFTPDNYDKEETFLREMSLQGWHFESYNVVSYIFVKGQPKAYSYRLDFRKKSDEDRQNYISMIEDCGWQNIFSFKYFSGSWEYFRKETEYGTDEELFTDNESKVDLLKRIKLVYSLVGAFFILINIPSFLNMLRVTSQMQSILPIAVVAIILWILLLVLYFKIYMRISSKINSLMSKKQ